MRVLITGGAAKCGTALVKLDCDRVFFDRAESPNSLAGEYYVQGDILNGKELTEAMKGCDAVVHLATEYPSQKRSWEDLLYMNTEMTQQVLLVASYLDVERVVYASSSEVMGRYEIESRPHREASENMRRVDEKAMPRPDSLHGLSKVFGEHLGCYYAEQSGPKFYAIRIGAVFSVEADHPYAEAEAGVTNGRWERNSEEYRLIVNRIKAKWLSRRDFVQLIDCVLKYDGPVFDIFYGVSENAGSWMNLVHTKKALGYRPQDSAEDWTAPPQSNNNNKRLP